MDEYASVTCLVDLLTRVNTTRDSMDEDGDALLSINFTAMGCVLLDFITAISEHMVRFWKSAFICRMK